MAGMIFSTTMMGVSSFIGFSTLFSTLANSNSMISSTTAYGSLRNISSSAVLSKYSLSSISLSSYSGSSSFTSSIGSVFTIRESCQNALASRNSCIVSKVLCSFLLHSIQQSSEQSLEICNCQEQRNKKPVTT